jgi:hypothetical protein
VDQDRWQTLVAVGGGATVRRVGDELCLPELAISRAIKDLLELGVVDIADAAPAGGVVSGLALAAPLPSEGPPRPLVAATPPNTLELAEPAAAPPAPKARRPKAAAPAADPDVFVPLELPGRGTQGSYDPEEAEDADPEPSDDLAAAFPGLAARAKAEPEAPTDEDEEIARQLSTLSPRAAQAIRAAAVATTDEERDAALDEVDEVDGEDQPLNRGLLLKFLSSVKS